MAGHRDRIRDTGPRAVDPSGSVEPWVPVRRRIINAFEQAAAFDRLAVWLTRPEAPRPDELLAQVGVPAHAVDDWCSRAHDHDGLEGQALLAGRAVGEWAETGLANPTEHAQRMHAVVHALPETHPQRRWWIAILGRTGAPYTDSERAAIDLALRQLQTSLNQPAEPGSARALAGVDDRPVSTDLVFQNAATRLGVGSSDLLRRFAEARDQHWPDPGDDSTHDLVMDFAAGPVWIVFRRTRAVDLPAATQWLIELRDPGFPAPPAVGELNDGRVARALAFIHDEFAANPSLNTIAAHVRVSPFHFHRLFTRTIGVSPKRCLQLKQTQIAARLLTRTHLPVRTIARLCGFPSHARLDAVFGRIAGATPSEFRASASP